MKSNHYAQIIFINHHHVVFSYRHLTGKTKKLAVYSHIVRLYGHTTEEILKRTKVIYSGPLVLGEDLMSFSMGDTVKMKAWQEK